MTGDDLITKITEAVDNDTAMSICMNAPLKARQEAADLLYIDYEWVRKALLCKHIVLEARG